MIRQRPRSLALEQRRPTRAACPSPTSSTSQPPGASTSRAPRRPPRSWPSPTSAARGSQSRTSGSSAVELVRRDVRRVRDDEVVRPAGKPVAEVARLRTRRRAPSRSAFSRASASASSETSIAVTRAPGCSSAIASAIAPDAGADVEHRRRVDAVEQREAALDDDLRLGPRARARGGRSSASAAGIPTRRGRTRAARAVPRRSTSARAAASSAVGQRPVVVEVELDAGSGPSACASEQLRVEPRGSTPLRSR